MSARGARSTSFTVLRIEAVGRSLKGFNRDNRGYHPRKKETLKGGNPGRVEFGSGVYYFNIKFFKVQCFYRIVKDRDGQLGCPFLVLALLGKFTTSMGLDGHIKEFPCSSAGINSVFPLPGLDPFPNHGHFAPGVHAFDIPDGFRNLLIRVGPVDVDFNFFGS